MINISKKIRTYIEENNLSIQDISDKTQIPKYKLEKQSPLNFNATELCVICSYLNVSPEDFISNIEHLP